MDAHAINTADASRDCQPVDQAATDGATIRVRIRSTDSYIPETTTFTIGGQAIPLATVNLPPYLLEDKPRVLAFLRANRDLVRFVDSAYQRLLDQFGETVILSLRIDNASGYSGGESLEITASTSYEPAEAVAAMQEVYDNWWLDNMVQLGDRITLTVEYDEL